MRKIEIAKGFPPSALYIIGALLIVLGIVPWHHWLGWGIFGFGLYRAFWGKNVIDKL